jgi:hypothetical protein
MGTGLALSRPKMSRIGRSDLSKIISVNHSKIYLLAGHRFFSEKTFNRNSVGGVEARPTSNVLPTTLPFRHPHSASARS